MNPLKTLLSPSRQATLFLRYFAFRKIPLLFLVRPSVERLDIEETVIKIPLRRRTRNHLSSMYFGALAIGADAAGGLMAMKLIMESGEKISLIFKSLEAQFLKRAEGDVFFTCRDGRAVQNLVRQAIDSGERVERQIRITATTPDVLGDEPVAEFKLILSLKKKAEEEPAHEE